MMEINFRLNLYPKVVKEILEYFFWIFGILIAIHCVFDTNDWGGFVLTVVEGIPGFAIFGFQDFLIIKSRKLIDKNSMNIYLDLGYFVQIFYLIFFKYFLSFHFRYRYYF